jgi:hypothetical protein
MSEHEPEVGDGGGRCFGRTRPPRRASHPSKENEAFIDSSQFGPCYVVCKTPVENVRITTFFAGEHEVRIIDPRRVEVVEAHGCGVVSLPLNPG